jgi:hypothetical protein
MKSPKHWEFAQGFSNRLMLKSCSVLILFGISGLFYSLNSKLEIALSILAILITLFYPVYLTEQALKRIDNEKDNSN